MASFYKSDWVFIVLCLVGLGLILFVTPHTHIYSGGYWASGAGGLLLVAIGVIAYNISLRKRRAKR